jgi:hypothetical protein
MCGHEHHRETGHGKKSDANRRFACGRVQHDITEPKWRDGAENGQHQECERTGREEFTDRGKSECDRDGPVGEGFEKGFRIHRRCV